MILCISFYNLIQRSRRIVHIRHHAANIDEVSPWGAVIGGVCLYLAPGLLFPRHIYRNSSITIGFADTPPAAQHNKLAAQASVCLSFKSLSSVSLPINIGSPPFKPNLDLPNRDLITLNCPTKQVVLRKPKKVSPCFRRCAGKMWNFALSKVRKMCVTAFHFPGKMC